MELLVSIKKYVTPPRFGLLSEQYKKEDIETLDFVSE